MRISGWNGLEIDFQGFSGFIAHRPFGTLGFCRFAPVVTGTADLHRHAGGELGWIDNGLAFLENGCLWKRRMPGPFPMAGLAGDGGFNEFLLVEVDPGGVTPAALEQPWVLFPGGLVVVHPPVRVGKILNRRDIEYAVLFDDVTLLPLAADGVFYVFDFGDEN